MKITIELPEGQIVTPEVYDLARTTYDLISVDEVEVWSQNPAGDLLVLYFTSKKGEGR